MNPAEQRAAPRRQVVVPVTVLVVADGRRLAGRTFDVSAVGLGLTLADSVAPGSAVAVACDLPTRQHGLVAVRASGRIVHCILVPQTGAHRLGLQWVTMPEDTLRALRAFSIGGPGS